MNLTIQELLIRHEGLSLKPYKDTAGKLTIGIGRNLDDVGISHDESMILLNNDIQIAETELNKNINCYKILTANRQNVLIDMCFNMGIHKLLEFKNMLGALQKEDYKLAAQEMLNSHWAKQVGHRATELSEMMING